MIIFFIFFSHFSIKVCVMTPYQHNINLIDAPCLFSKNNVILTLHELLGALLDDVAL